MIINALLRIGFVCSKTALAEVVSVDFAGFGRRTPVLLFDNSGQKNRPYINEVEWLN